MCKIPDYFDASPFAYFFNRLTEHIYQPGGSQGYTELTTNSGPRYNVTFGQTYVNLTHVGAETTVNVQGVNSHPQSSNIPFYSELLGGVITDPRAYVNRGWRRSLEHPRRRQLQQCGTDDRRQAWNAGRTSCSSMARRSPVGRPVRLGRPQPLRSARWWVRSRSMAARPIRSRS